MEEKFNSGLANQTFAEFENVKNIREEFIAAKADQSYIETLEDIMDKLYKMYLQISNQ